jgi:DNA-binding transcriptional ArsR family regulator
MSMSELIAPAAPELPCSGLEWRQWARKQVVALKLPRGERALLKCLADLANGNGSSWPGVAKLAEQLDYSERHVRRLLASLRDRGVLDTTQRGQRSAIRELTATRQLSFDDLLCDTAASRPALRVSMSPTAAAPRSVPTPAPAEAPQPTRDTSNRTWVSGQTGHGGQPEVPVKDQSFTTEEGARERAQTTCGVLSPSLPVVLEILDRAPGLHIVEAAVDATLRAFPDGDHEQAAYRVLSWAAEGGLGNSAANRLLFRALERQALDRPGRADKPRQRPAAGRRRGVVHDDGAAAARLREMRVLLAEARGEVVS